MLHDQMIYQQGKQDQRRNRECIDNIVDNQQNVDNRKHQAKDIELDRVVTVYRPSKKKNYFFCTYLNI